MPTVFIVSLTAVCVCVCVQVTGEANENQVCEALGRYTERECFVQKALLHLYRLTTDADRAQPDTLKVFTDGFHPTCLW